LLLEQNDFGSGSTARTSRVVPGGLRQVESRNLGDARTLLREQDSLLRAYPHHVQAQEFLLALDPAAKRSSLKVKSALWVYKQMQTSHLQKGARANPQTLQQMLPHGKQHPVFSYEGAVCTFPERLLATWLSEAVAFGATVRNYTQVLAVDVRHGRAQGVLLRDQLTGYEERVGATWIINATGPWAERLCQRSRVETRTPILSTVRSTHILLPLLSDAPQMPISFDTSDNQHFYLLPWDGQLLLGHTEAADRSDPSKIAPSTQDIETLLGALRYFLPSVHVSHQDVRYAFSGLFAKPVGNTDSETYIIHDHAQHGAANLFSVVGGILTTAFLIARECASRCGNARIDSESGGEQRHASDGRLDNWLMELRDAAHINEEAATTIAEWHGARSANIAQLAASDARMRAPLCSHSEHIVAEAVDAYQAEFAITLADVLLRRVPVALDPCWSQACGREAVTRIQAVMGWTAPQAAAELESFEMERSSLKGKSPAVRMHALQTAAD
jgi:glycerol-3-phosphate dehydrogenase